MGKKSPAAPDPYATAQAQGRINTEAAQTQARLNRGNTFTPQGSVTSRDLGAEWLRDTLSWAEQNDPNYRDPNNREGARRYYEETNPFRDQWETRVTLSPEQQALYDQGLQLDQRTGQMALDMLPEAQRVLSSPMATDDVDARNRASAAIMSRLEPQFQRDREGLESRLLSQGFVPGSEAYTRAADELSRARTDARLQADAQGVNESRSGAAFTNALRGQRINEIGALFGLGPGQMNPQQAQLAQVAVAAPDLQEAIYANYRNRAAAQQASNANLANLAGAVAGRVGASNWFGRALGFGL